MIKIRQSNPLKTIFYKCPECGKTIAIQKGTIRVICVWCSKRISNVVPMINSLPLRISYYKGGRI